MHGGKRKILLYEQWRLYELFLTVYALFLHYQAQCMSYCTYLEAPFCEAVLLACKIASENMWI